MDELFRINSPAKVHKEIKLDDDDEENIFSGNNSTATPEPVSIKPAMPVQKKADEQTYSSLSSSMNNKVPNLFISKNFEIFKNCLFF